MCYKSKATRFSFFSWLTFNIKVAEKQWDPCAYLEHCTNRLCLNVMTGSCTSDARLDQGCFITVRGSTIPAFVCRQKGAGVRTQRSGQQMLTGQMWMSSGGVFLRGWIVYERHQKAIELHRDAKNQTTPQRRDHNTTDILIKTEEQQR